MSNIPDEFYEHIKNAEERLAAISEGYKVGRYGAEAVVAHSHLIQAEMQIANQILAGFTTEVMLNPPMDFHLGPN